MEIGLCNRGEGIALVEGKTCGFTAGDLYIVCPNTMHITKSCDGTDSQWEYLYIDTQRLFKEYLHGELPNASLLMFDSPDFPNIISVQSYPHMRLLLQQILHEMEGKRENYRISAACLCISFLIELLRFLPRESESHFSNLRSKLVIYPAIQYIDSHYMEPVRIEELSARCCLSLTHFRRLFKSIMGEGPLNYLNRIRINKSCELLYSTEDTVLDIALQVGFSGNTSYNRNFTQIMGTTPLQWRKKSRSVTKNDMAFSIFPCG
ncbi:AraC family transcriptional regulator [Lachnotalea sp. AF33-28]|nr:AraC family transcriptional regulator [Lachnotalea sp. AF33-28]